MSRNCFEDPVSWVYLSRNCSLSHEDQNAARLPARHDVTADEDEPKKKTGLLIQYLMTQERGCHFRRLPANCVLQERRVEEIVYVALLAKKTSALKVRNRTRSEMNLTAYARLDPRKFASSSDLAV